ncbi:MAG: hypothetical protein JETCAE01_33300 [Anaerolineaceae bacterium]|nr:MAG: hypothetical protein JETCAE01_33300 [Anaerolineaceae bacterium]
MFAPLDATAAANASLGDHAIPVHAPFNAMAAGSQLIPSCETIELLVPTTTNKLNSSSHAIAIHVPAVAVRAVHVIPSGLVAI